VDASLCSLSTLPNTRRVDKRSASTSSSSASTNAGVDTEDELAVLKQCQQLLESESEADKKVKDAQKALDAKVFAQYTKLTEAEIKQLAVEDKWLAAIEVSVQAEVERVTQNLAARIKTLEERYTDPLPKITEEVATLSVRVEDHLKRMGIVWGSSA
jgi:type I restriction enzyme M protein